MFHSELREGESPNGRDSIMVMMVLGLYRENVLWGSLITGLNLYCMNFCEKLKRSQVTDKDLLINLVGASVGRACLATIGKSYANVNQAVSVTTLNSSRILPEIALIQILLPSLQRTLIGECS